MDRETLRGSRVAEGLSSQANMGQVDLVKRLDQLIQQEPEKYPVDSIERVKQFIGFEIASPTAPKRYRIFQSIEDFHLYHSLHPEWQGKSPIAMQLDRDHGGNAFYISFSIWVRKKAQRNKEEGRKLLERVFPMKYSIWSSLDTLDAWKTEFSKHPDWQMMSISQMKSDKESGALAFYSSFYRWVRNEAKGDRRKRRDLIQTVCPSRKFDWTTLTTIEDWAREFAKHSEWQNRTIAQMRKDTKSGASKFYGAFKKWAKGVAKGDKTKRRMLLEYVFQPSNFSWTTLTTIEDWAREFAKHSEWQNRTIAQMHKDTKSGASKFYGAFSSWLGKTVRTEEEREEFMKAIFPDKRSYSRKRNVNGAGEFISPEEARKALIGLYEEEGD